MITEANMMHGVNYRGEDVAGWLMSEKLNGCRAYWDGKQMWTRGGKVILLPASFDRYLPDYPLDGEIYSLHGGFEAARQAVQYNRWTFDCSFKIFDAPEYPGPFSERYDFIRAHFHNFACPVNFIAHVPIENISLAVLWMTEVQKFGGEGVVLRHPDNLYRPGRTNQILKLKETPA